jgi:hypothetical protein
MPIIERTPDRCFDRFRDHINELIAATLSPDRHVHCVRSGDRRTLAFREGEPTTIPIKTKVGTLHFYLGQSLETVKEGRRQYRLRTCEYWYRLQEKPGLSEPAFLRWEYDASLSPKEPKSCRNHLHVAAPLQIASGPGKIESLHIPTGWVLIEEVLRFLIVELGVQPPCGAAWPAKLAASERKFFENFSSKPYCE